MAFGQQAARFDGYVQAAADAFQNMADAYSNPKQIMWE
jgi:hypothetical protein